MTRRVAPASKLIEIGWVPPPFGGVAVHLERLLPHLKQSGIPCHLLDVGGVKKDVDGVICTRWRNAILRLLREPRAVVHFHNFTSVNLIVYALLGLRHITILSLHNARFIEELRRTPSLVRPLLIRLLNRLDVIVVNSDTCRAMLAPLIKNARKIIVCPEFIPPAATEATNLPAEVHALRDRHEYLLAANAFRLCFHRGEDLYGADLLLELVGALVHEDGLDVAMAFLLPTVGDERYLSRLTRRIEELGLRDRFRFVTEPVPEACALWRISDVVIRATNTDGNSLSVMEALWCGTPVIASNCAPRNAAVVQFRSRDLTDLKTKAREVIAHLDDYRARAQSLSFEDNVKPLLEIYRRCLAAQ